MTTKYKRPTWTKKRITLPVKNQAYDLNYSMQKSIIRLLQVRALMDLIRKQNQDMCNQNNISLGGYFGFYRLVLTNQFVLNPVGHGLFQTAEYNEEKLEKSGIRPETIVVTQTSATPTARMYHDIPRPYAIPQPRPH